MGVPASEGSSAHFDILGPLEVRLGNRLIGLPRVKERTLLGLLVLHSNEAVSLDHLTAGLWEDSDLRPPATLRVHISRLRRSLAALGTAAPPLVASRQGYVLNIGPEAVDARQFERLAAEGRLLLRSGEATAASNTLSRALGLWRGSVLKDLGLSAGAEPEIGHLEEARLDAVEDRVEADLMCGASRELVAELERLVSEHPLRERLWGERMVALYRSGRQVEALRAYQDLRTLLAEQLGIFPSPDLQRLERAVLEQDPALASGPLVVTNGAVTRGGHSLESQRFEVPAPTRLTTGDGLRFCGRLAEIDSLLQALKNASNEESKLVLVSGEAGIGKTRLAEEVARRALDRGSTVLYGRCDEDLAVPFQPFVEALTQVVRARPRPELFGRHAGELVRLVPKMDSAVPGLPPPLRADLETERYRLFDAVASWLGSVSPNGETILVIDDLHWSEQSTILLLRHLVRSVEPMRLLIVATYRDTEVSPDHPLSDFLADLGTDARVQRMPLVGLDLAAVNEMVNGVGGTRPTETISELSQLLWSETVGNPLFVQEILRNLVERGILGERRGALTTSEPITSIDIPESVREVVVRRLRRMSPSTRMVLSVASVTGVAIDYDAVVSASGLDEEVVLDALDEATAAAIVRETPSGSYEFVHPLVRSTIYTNLGSARRHQRHRIIAEALIQRPGSDPVSVSYHLDRADEADPRIVEQLATAGNKALQRLAFDESVGHFSRALDALATVDPSGASLRRRCELLVALGTAERLAGSPAHRDHLLEAAQLAQDLGESDLLVRAVLVNNRGFASAVGAIDVDQLRFIEAALAVVGSGDSPNRARLLSVMGLERIWDDPGLSRLDLVDEAMGIARRLGDDACLLNTWTAAHVAGSIPDQIPKLLGEAPSLIALAERCGDAPQQAAVCAITAIHYVQFAELEIAESLLERIDQLAKEFNHPFLRWIHANHRCWDQTIHGTGNQIEAAALEALHLGQAAGQADALTWFAPELFAARWAQGRLAEMVPLIDRLASGSPLLPAWQAGLAVSCISAGDHKRAASIVDDLIAKRESVFPQDVAWLLGHSVLAEAVAAVGTPEQAGLEYKMLFPYAGRIPNLAMVARPAVSLWLAMLAARAGWTEAATAHFSDAMHEHERIDAHVFLAFTQLEWGKFLLRQGETEVGRAVLTEAEKAAVRLGSAGIANAGAALLAQTPA
ncbi:MAG: BTAD domain-containing putative transcriptional regulator [Acidimicrobiales bacterium]